MKKIFFLSIAVMVCVMNAGAEPVLNVFKIKAENADEKIVANVNNAIYGFLSENREYKITDCRSFASPEAENVPRADFSFYGTLSNSTDELQLDLVLKSTGSGTTRLLSRNYANVNLILLESKTLLQQLLNLNYELPVVASSKGAGASETVSSGIPGTWSGESDIKSIKLLQNGRGVIIFNSGVSISVDYVVQNGTVEITQKGAITERQFPNVPAELVAEVLKKAVPLTWKLKLNETTLSGVRIETTVTVASGQISSIKNETHDVTWKKLR